MKTFTIVPSGAFSLRESAEFGFGQRDSQEFDGVFRLAFVQDGYRRSVGVEVRQDDKGVHGAIVGGDGDVAAVQGQVARVLSLDHDAAGFAEVGERDPVIGALQRVAPGLLPPLFYSPYEAAAWSVLSARRPAAQMAEVRRRLSESHGESFDLAGNMLASFLLPEQLRGVNEFPGLPPEKINRLHDVAEAALAGELDIDRLQALGPDEATKQLQSIKGIGPFYAMLITIRATGFTDVLPTTEPKALALVTELYGLDKPCDATEMARIAEKWRPYRTWATVLIRAAGERLKAGET